jgi:hypothetical protein
MMIEEFKQWYDDRHSYAKECVCVSETLGLKKVA